MQQKAQHDLGEAKAEVKRLESAVVNDTEKAELRVQLAELQVCIVNALPAPCFDETDYAEACLH